MTTTTHTSTPDLAPGFDIRHYVAILRRRRLLIVITALVILAGALVISVTETPSYSASAEIVFTPTPSALTENSSIESINPARDVETQIEVLTSSPVRSEVARALKVATAPTITATANPNANAFDVTASSTDPVQAARIANAYANTYISFTKNQTVNDLLDAEQAIQGRITDLQQQINTITAQINSTPPASLASTQANLSLQLNALLDQQSALKQQLDQSQLGSALANTGAQLGSPASIPTTPTSPHTVTNALSGVLAGLFVGVLLAFLVDKIDDSIKTREDAERAAFGLQALGLVPAIPRWKDKDKVVLASLGTPASPAAESFRSLRTAIQFLTLDRSLHVVQVTSPGSSEGKTSVVANLAVAFGRDGSRVCAVDGDLRRPRLHQFFDCPAEPGFTSVTTGQAPLSQVMQATSSSNVSLLSSGPAPANPSEVLGSSRAAGVLASLAGQFDIVLVDSAPVLPVTDATVLARHADGVIVVVDAGHTKRRALTRALEVLRQVDAPILGLIVNRGNEEARYLAYDYRTPSETGKKAGKSAGKSKADGKSKSAGQANPTKRDDKLEADKASV